MDELQYWKLKAEMATISVEEMSLSSRLIELNNRKKEVMKANGFQTDKIYKWNDDKYEIEEINDKSSSNSPS